MRVDFSDMVDTIPTLSELGDSLGSGGWIVLIVVFALALLAAVFLFFALNWEEKPSSGAGFCFGGACSTCGRVSRFESDTLVVTDEQKTALIAEYGWVLTTTELFCPAHKAPYPIATTQHSSLAPRKPGQQIPHTYPHAAGSASPQRDQ